MTTMVRWTPIRDLDLMERQMRRMLGDSGFAPTTLPAADVYETPDEFVVELEVPGFDEKELEIEVSDHALTVRAESQETKEEQERDFLLRERLDRSFERRFLLPKEADADKLTASFAKGVLEIHAPKMGEATSRKIAIDGET